MHLARLLPRCTSTSLSKSVRSFQSSSFSSFSSSSASVVRKQQKRKSWFARHLASNTTNFTTSSRSASGSTTPASRDGGDDAGYTSKFVHAVSFLPHPDKGEHGEDAYFISDNNQIAGVADGVGGWIEMGIDAGAFSRELMNNAKDFAKKEDSLNPGDILASAYFSTTALGTCTACIIALDGEELRAINVGDSGFSILRRQVDQDPSRAISEINDDPPQWALYFQTTEQTHFFNCPFQLGTNSRDSPSDGQQFHLPMEHGDLIILATDGVIDNIFTAEMIQVREWGGWGFFCLLFLTFFFFFFYFLFSSFVLR